MRAWKKSALVCVFVYFGQGLQSLGVILLERWLLDGTERLQPKSTSMFLLLQISLSLFFFSFFIVIVNFRVQNADNVEGFCSASGACESGLRWRVPG